MAPRKRKTEVTTEVTQNESSTQRVTRSSTRRVTRSSTRGASGVKLVQPQPEVPVRKKAKGAPKKKQTKKEKEKVEDEAEEEAAKEEEKTEESGEEPGDENDEEKEEGEGEEEGTENADDEESNKKTIVIEHCKQCTSFKTRANKVKDGLEKGVPGITVLLNPDKPRKGCFEIREEGGETYISLLDMKRPFPAMKELNMEEVINDIIEKIK